MTASGRFSLFSVRHLSTRSRHLSFWGKLVFTSQGLSIFLLVENLLRLIFFAVIVIHMDNYRVALDAIFHALSDPTRRAVVHRLGAGPATVSELSEPFDMA